MTGAIDTPGFAFGVSFMCLTLTLYHSSMVLWANYSRWTNPSVQKDIVGIILIAPIYCIDAFIRLMNYQGIEALYTFIDCAKEVYVAVMISKFLTLLYGYMTIPISQYLVPNKIKERRIRHFFPGTLFKRNPVVTGRSLKLLRNWTRQFMVIRPLLPITMNILRAYEIHPGRFSWIFPTTLSISFFLAFYAPLIFYRSFAQELAPHKLKVYSFLGMIASYLLQVAEINTLGKLGLFRCHFISSRLNLTQECLQNIAVCALMVIVTRFQHDAFSPHAPGSTNSWTGILSFNLLDTGSTSSWTGIDALPESNSNNRKKGKKGKKRK